MSLSLLVTTTQVVGLLLLGGGAIALLRLLTIHFVQHDWSDREGRALLATTATLAAGLLLFAFSSGGHFAATFFKTNNLPPLPLLALQVVLLIVLSASVVFLHVIAKPWFSDDEDGRVTGRPLVMTLNVHRLLAVALALAALVTGWCLWLVVALSVEAVPGAAQVFAALALMTLLLWLLLAAPAVALRAAAVHALRDERPAFVPSPDAVPQRRVLPLLGEEPQPTPVIAHVPAPRAPRPLLIPRDDYFSG